MNSDARGTALVFGATGAIGSGVARSLSVDHRVFGTTRCSDLVSESLLLVDPLGERSGVADALAALPELDVVVWAQGTNRNDSIETFDVAAFREVFDGNCTFVAETLAALCALHKIRSGARLCVVSSIWQQTVRPGKLSYTVSKAAVGGLVRAAAAELASSGIVINAVLPGVLDTPMTRAALDEEQIAEVELATGFKRLPSVDEVVAAVRALCDRANTGMTGQSVTVDLGFGGVRLV